MIKSTLYLLGASLLLVGCAQDQEIIDLQQRIQIQQMVIEQQARTIAALSPSRPVVQKPIYKKPKIYSKPLPPKPHTNIKLKKVEDTNYSNSYMYQGATTAKKAPSALANVAMSEAECVSILTQEKFDRYLSLLGSKAAVFKRCVLIKKRRGR